MKIESTPFEIVDWQTVSAVKYPGETGAAFWRTKQAGEIRVRMVEYSPGYLADHRCQKGHILLVLDGTLVTELADRRSKTETGVKLFIVD